MYLLILLACHLTTMGYNLEHALVLNTFYRFKNEISLIPERIKIVFSSVAQSCPTLCDLMDCSTPDFHVQYHLPELTQ